MTLNGYYTKWMEVATVTLQKRGQFNGDPMNGEYFSMSLENVSAQHIGLELDFAFNPPAGSKSGVCSHGATGNGSTTRKVIIITSRDSLLPALLTEHSHRDPTLPTMHEVF